MQVKSASECKYDILSLGEVMIRLDPGEERIHTTRHFRAWEGGGEYNVARGLKRCFRKRAALVTALVNNPLGRLLEDLIYQGGVDMEYCVWRDYDGIGRKTRVGLNFTERGYGVRAAVGCSDRGNTAVSQLKVGEINWEKIFGEDGVRWFHTGGIFAALSDTTPELVIEAVKAAKKYGTIVSYDLNYRPSLWKGRGGKAVTLIKGLPLAAPELKTLAKALKKKCGVGGAIKDGVIEIQGDQRELLKSELEKLGHVVKIAGG